MAYLHGKFVWFEHVSSSIDKARAFYEPLLGWKSEAMAVGADTYYMIKNGADAIGGYRTATHGEPAHWISYLSVADVDASAKAAQAAGAKVLLPPTDFGPVGRAAALADPTGAAFCVWKGTQGDPADVQKTPHGGWLWNECVTQDEKKALAFYEKVFGYTHDAMPMQHEGREGGTYYVLKKGDAGRGGIMKCPMPGVPSHWLPYAAVSDCDASLAQAKKLGAKEMVPATDIPNIGRFAVFTDPLGAALAVMKPAM
jgi:predicted enzyme related to lactoylglutathione lyase